ncbi:hypothetical protein ILYODFUR_009180 [Ilyodon furcidens]|uniref:DUF1524 domain-containing protein n=1 Tax=Ilyodon furcidens TaxID=33524 RepID=A0ABV0T7S6_9TELE
MMLLLKQQIRLIKKQTSKCQSFCNTSMEKIKHFTTNENSPDTKSEWSNLGGNLIYLQTRHGYVDESVFKEPHVYSGDQRTYCHCWFCYSFDRKQISKALVLENLLIHKLQTGMDVAQWEE